MLGAAILAQTSQDKDGGDSKDSRNFEFLFATVMLHELCHVFFTYLTKGHHFTPPSMKASVATAAPKNQGESGYLIEEMVFGGPISIFRDPIVGSSETSVCSSIDCLGIQPAFEIGANSCPERRAVYTYHGWYVRNRSGNN